MYRGDGGTRGRGAPDHRVLRDSGALQSRAFNSWALAEDPVGWRKGGIAVQAQYRRLLVLTEVRTGSSGAGHTSPVPGPLGHGASQDSCPCAQRLLPRGVHCTAGTGGLHFQALTNSEALDGAGGAPVPEGSLMGALQGLDAVVIPVEGPLCAQETRE